MANNKTGFNYFNIDTDRYQDIKIKRLKKDFGCAGIAVYDYILTEIYRVKGCFLEWDESTAFDVSDYFALKESTVNEIVNYCCVVGLFDKVVLTSERILTSLSIQKRYVEMCSRAKRLKCEIPEKINLLLEKRDIIPEECKIVPEGCDKVKKSKVNNTVNKYLFVSIKNLNEYIRTFEGNKTYLLLAYRLWEVWREIYPNHKHLPKADVYDWINTIRLIVEVDKQPKRRLVAVLLYLRLCKNGDKRISNFWFETIKSIKALRNTDRNGVSYLDSISDEINKAIDKHEEIKSLMSSTIKKFEDYESNQSPEK